MRATFPTVTTAERNRRKSEWAAQAEAFEHQANAAEYNAKVACENMQNIAEICWRRVAEATRSEAAFLKYLSKTLPAGTP